MYREVVLHSSKLRPRNNFFSKAELRGLLALIKRRNTLFSSKNSLTDDLKFLGWAFQEYQIVIITWLILHFTIICIFFPSTLLRLYYLQINSLNSNLINLIFTALYVIYLSLIVIVCDKIILYYKLGLFCSFSILMEKV